MVKSLCNLKQNLKQMINSACYLIYSLCTFDCETPTTINIQVVNLSWFILGIPKQKVYRNFSILVIQQTEWALNEMWSSLDYILERGCGDDEFPYLCKQVKPIKP